MQEFVMDFMNVTQRAAIASYPWIGKGRKVEADGAGTEAMREQLNHINIDGVVQIGEGEMDGAPMLYIGEKIGTGKGPRLDIAVDPIEGTSLVAKGQDNSIAVIATSERGSLLHAPDMYMKKIAVGPKAVGKIDIDASLVENMNAVAEGLNKDVSDLNIMVQERVRHQSLIDDIQSAGAGVKLFTDVDITGVVATSVEEMDIDMLIGTGGAPEGVVAAVALKCLGGELQGKLVPQSSEEYDRCVSMGLLDPEKALTMNDIVSSDHCSFVATGITGGILLNGVSKKDDDLMQTHSFVTYGNSGKYHFIESFQCPDFKQAPTKDIS